MSTAVMTREELLYLANGYFSCFNAEASWDVPNELILCSEHGQDVTDEMIAFVDALLELHELPKSGLSRPASR